MATVTLYPCLRCNGNGRISVYSNVLGGVCFKCAGTGKQKGKPSAPALQWAVFFLEVATGAPGHAYNVTGKTAAEAIRKARATLGRAPEAFRLRFDPEQAAAFHVSEVEADYDPETGLCTAIRPPS